MNKHDLQKSIDPTATISPQVWKLLRHRIVNNDLPPGHKLSEGEIAKELGVSRQPVREAFIKLAGEGFVMIRPQRSTLVREIDVETVLQLRFVREAVEADIVSTLAEDPDPSLVKDLRAELKRQRSIRKGDPQAFYRADQDFHRILMEAAGKGVAWKYIDEINGQMDRVRVLSYGIFPIEALIEQHADIVEKIAVGTQGGANLAMRNHLNEMLRTLPEIVQQNPEHFENITGLESSKLLPKREKNDD